MKLSNAQLRCLYLITREGYELRVGPMSAYLWKDKASNGHPYRRGIGWLTAKALIDRGAVRKGAVVPPSIAVYAYDVTTEGAAAIDEWLAQDAR